MIPTQEQETVSSDNQRLTLGILREQIPKECFEKSTLRSICYLIRDMALIGTSYFTFEYFATTWLGLFAYWNIYGFLMWCLFVIGHDCGHGSFSRYPIINHICGHICHTPLLVPFFPWAYSHSKHHQFHNHQKKDKSYPWFTDEEMKESKIGYLYLRSFLTPFTAYAFYLYAGVFDGSHIAPWGKLFHGAPKKEKIKCVISGLTIAAFVTLLSTAFSSWSQLFLAYGGCWVMFSLWLFMVTYLQHHDYETFVYDDASWNFLAGGLETIDRKYGFGIDQFHHNVTDGHMVHHLFFSQIPHYHLKKATDSISKILGNKYKFRKHRFVFVDFWRIFWRMNFSKWTLVKKKDPPSSQ